VPAPRTALRRGRDLARALVGRMPYAIAVAAERRLRRESADAIASWAPDVVQAEGIGVAPYLEIARAAGIPTVYSAHDLAWRIAAGAPGASTAAARMASERMRRAEEGLARGARAVVAVSQIEAEWFRRVAGDVRCIPNAIDLDRYAFIAPGARGGGDVVFLGHLGYPPNVDAATRLVRCILPRIRSLLGGVRCVVAGRAPARAVRRLAGDGVSVLGDVESAAEIWRRAAALVCPLRWGGGSRLKLLEAAACGVPIAGTAFAAEGLSLRAGRDYLSGESDEELALAAVCLLSDPARAGALASSARATVAAEHDWRRWSGRIAELYEDLAGHHG
jgi:glycosyltransferase involved in cell wall biosynthesis